MELTKENFRDFNPKKLKKPDHINQSDWDKAIKKLTDLKKFIDEMLRITQSDIDIPERLRTEVTVYTQDYISQVKEITKQETGGPRDRASKKEHALQRFNNWYRECLEDTTKHHFYVTFNTLKSLAGNNFEDERVKIETTINYIEKAKASIDTMLQELQKKASKETISNYAQTFGDEAGEHDTSAWVWLVMGILMIGLFIAALFCGFYDRFPTDVLLADGKTIKYNLSNVLVKVLLFSIQIFLISFSFKQYSINRHLKVVNKHRQNGLNSFKLFVESINKEDTETRHALMLHLAKAIYEQSATGYIGNKNQNVNPGIIEITKMIGTNKL